MRTTHDLSALPWQVAGFMPHMWEGGRTLELGLAAAAEVGPVPAVVPGSVQAALRAADLLPDWNVGLQARACEWVENRHWVFYADLPDEWLAPGQTHRLHCLGLDYAGVVRLNHVVVASFANTFLPVTVDLTDHLAETGNRLEIIFTAPPRWLGQFGYTSRMTEWKTRFNYTWDWVSRLVQIGIWDDLALEVDDGAVLEGLACRSGVDLSGPAGCLHLTGTARGGHAVRVGLYDAAGAEVRLDELPADAFSAGGVAWSDLLVELWWPNLSGGQPLYRLVCTLLDAAQRELDRWERTVGFKQVEWQTCPGGPGEAAPFLCVVNGTPVFLQGVNWTPIRPNFADVPPAEYRQRLALYRDLGCNVLRVWGGGFLEKEVFYRLCDEFGLLVWQEFPLSSSGLDNWPPEAPEAVDAVAAIAGSYVRRRQHHASLLCWCGGNELQGALDGGKQGCGKPVDETHPLIARLAAVVAQLDPGRRFLPTSSSGPRFMAAAQDFGARLHWDVHGPWRLPGKTLAEARAYWEADDALFRSETGAPGASPVALIEAYAGPFPLLPADATNPLWRRTSWWIEWEDFIEEKGAPPESLAAYVAWSQERQAAALGLAAAACKKRFPGIGGFIVWMGHDAFPCTANTAVVDFHGEPKPAAWALRAVFRGEDGEQTP